MSQHAATYIQRAFRGRNDDGSESAATWIVAENTNWTQEGNGLFRVRFGVRQDTSNADTNLSKQFKLKFSHNASGFVDVGAQSASGIAVRYGDSSHLTDDEATTEQLLIGDQFVAGRVLEVAPTGAITFPSGTRSLTEIEAVLEIVASEVSDDDTIVLRVYESDDTALSTYEQAPTITIGLPAVEELTVTGVLPDLAASATLAASADLAVAGTLPGLVGAFTLDAAADTFDPTGAELNIIGTTAFITWDASPTPGVEDYQVFRRTPPTEVPFDPTSDTPIATGIVGTSYDDEGLAVDDYDWQVFGRVPA